jgi:hypothetical protein
MDNSNNPNELRMQRPRIRGIADIVFCIDFSPSMRTCIDGVKDHVSTFVQSIEQADPNKAIDWRIAFVGYSSKELVVCPFTKDPASFAQKLAGAKVKRADEFTAGAIDYCISELDWRPVSNKFLVVFTDETLKNGFTDEGRVIELFPQFLKKVGDSGVWLFFFGPECPYYDEFKRYARGKVTVIRDKFARVSFGELFSFLGKTVSNSTGQGQEAKGKLPMVFDLSKFTINLA